MAAEPQKQTDPETVEGTDYKALLEQAQKDLEAAKAEAEKWKGLSKKNEGRAKSNASAAKDLEEANAQIAIISERLAAIEDENATLKASAARAEIVSKVAKATGVSEAIVSSLAATDEAGLTEAATAIAQAYKPGGAPLAPEAGAFPRDDDGATNDWLRDALTNS